MRADYSTPLYMKILAFLVTLFLLFTLLGGISLHLSYSNYKVPAFGMQSASDSAGALSGSSLNWAGYAIIAPVDSVSDIKGSWTVPSVNCPFLSDTDSASWVGIDGANSNTVEQIGTSSDCVLGVVDIYAWYEFYPAPSIPLLLNPVHAGDKMNGQVRYSNGEFTLTLADVTRGWVFTTSGTAPTAQRSSAEWIVERPSNILGLTSLSDFGTTHWSSDKATIAGSTRYIGQFASLYQVVNIKMVDSSGKTLALTSALSRSGGFTVFWQSSS